jgi:hypothetical protein
MKRKVLMMCLMCGLTVNARAQSVAEEASGIFDVVMLWTACQTFSGASELQAMERTRPLMGKVGGAFLAKRPEITSELAKLLPEGGKRYEQQIKFLRTLSGDNRRVVCFGVNDTMKPFLD